MESVKNYYQISQIEIDKIQRENLSEKKTLALHACCAPCSTFPLEFLTPVFDVTIVYYNPNIYPGEEYVRRRDELKRYVEIFNREHREQVRFVELDCDSGNYEHLFSPLKEEAEGGNRCKGCYAYRMNRVYRFADERRFDYFTTVMSISRQKNSQVINRIGEKLSTRYRTKYFYSDFKKKKGIDRSQELRKRYGLYNQLYCGCRSSYEKFLKKEAARNEKL